MEKRYNIFVLEDNEDRIKWFNEVFDEIANVTVCTNAYNALHMFIRHGEFDMVFLDHDLGDNADTSNNGEKVADQFVNDVDFLRNTEPVIIHSSDTIGAERIRRALDGRVGPVHVIPFVSLIRWGHAEILKLLKNERRN